MVSDLDYNIDLLVLYKTQDVAFCIMHHYFARRYGFGRYQPAPPIRPDFAPDPSHAPDPL
jgi:hypothetical protein